MPFKSPQTSDFYKGWRLQKPLWIENFAVCWKNLQKNRWGVDIFCVFLPSRFALFGKSLFIHCFSTSDILSLTTPHPLQPPRGWFRMSTCQRHANVPKCGGMGRGSMARCVNGTGPFVVMSQRKKPIIIKKIILLPKAVSVFFWLNFYGENTQSSKSVVLTGGCQRQDVSWTGEGWDNGGLTQENIHFKRRFWGQFHSPKLSPKSGIPLGAVRWVGAPPGPKTVHSWSSLTSSCKEMAEFVKHMFTISCMLGQDYFAFCFRVSRKKMTFCIFFAAVHDSIPYNCLKTSVKFFITCCNIFRENC